MAAEAGMGARRRRCPHGSRARHPSRDLARERARRRVHVPRAHARAHREGSHTRAGKGPDPRVERAVLSRRCAGRVNGVSARHREESRRIWQWMWGSKPLAEVPIGYVTNGVHLGTWMARPIRDLLATSLGSDWESHADPAAVAAAVRTLDDEQLWAVHEGLRHLLFHYIREEARHRWRVYWKDPAKLAGAGALLSPNVLTLGFARRFATYKRADLLFRDPERLRRLLPDPRSEE